MTTQRTISAGSDPERHLRRALAALREAAEHLHEAAAACEHPDLAVASASSQVAAARKAIAPHGFITSAAVPETDAA